MATDPIFIGSYKTAVKSFGIAIASRPTGIITAGALGSRVHAINVSTNRATSNTIVLYYAKPITLQSNMGGGTHVDGGVGTDSVTRGTGSFVTDGWKPDDMLLVQNSTTLANDYLARLTAVSSTALTFGTGIVNIGEALPTGSILYKASAIGTFTLPANSGQVAGTAAFDILDNLIFTANKPDEFLTLGALDILALSVGTPLGSTERVEVTAFYGDF
jgi:hypothetical protein